MIKSLSHENKIIILMKFSTKEIRSIGKDGVPEYVWWRKCHETPEEAAKAGNLIGMIYLLDNTKIMDSIDYIGILLIGIEYGHLQIVRYFIEECGINVDIDSGYLLLHSVKSGHLPIVEYLVGKGANVRRHFNEGLRICAEKDNKKVFKYLMDYNW
jgi:hypothetical protein